MSYEHRELAAGRWQQMSLVEQMANVGSEVERALNWRERNNPDYATKSFDRALELLDLTLDSPANRFRLKEVARARELFVDYFLGTNEYASSPSFFKKYFIEFAYLARNKMN